VNFEEENAINFMLSKMGGEYIPLESRYSQIMVEQETVNVTDNNMDVVGVQ